MLRLKEPKDGAAPSREEIAENFSDLHPPLASAQAAIEASRCLYCYDAPCIAACPTGIDIPTFIHQIRTRNVSGSARTILSANIMGGTCARACPTEVLCEEACVVNRTEGAPVKIGELQRYAVDHLMEKGGPHPFRRAAPTGRRLAVIGAGPAGLSFAHRAAMLGHEVRVFEARAKPGGLNEYGLAAYKMVDDFAQAEVDFLLGIGGIEVDYGVALGTHITLGDLREDYDAVFLGAGLSDVAGLGLPGEDLGGIRDAIDFIAELRQATDKSEVKVGSEVVVIGGGNTAIDAAVQARRLGARSVTMVYRRGPHQMSATPWEQELAQINGVAIRHWAAPVGFEGEGHVARALFRRTAMKDGALQQTDELFSLHADMVLKAVGQKLDPGGFAELKTEGGKIWVNADYQTSLQGVYAGGDCIAAGDDLTVQAVEDGKRAALSVDKALSQGQEA